MKLLLAASINSTQKQIYVEIIMGMNEKQEQLMYVIQNLVKLHNQWIMMTMMM